ncbi:MAG: hypothetical protein JNK05_33540 [Myxococcales bacterium]|nr:hypothetical protein [Myxococcales bacterium]
MASMLSACGARVSSGSDGGDAASDSGADTGVDVRVPVMRGGRGALCASDDECEMGLLCALDANIAHVCTVPCTNDEECAESGSRCAVDRVAGRPPRTLCGVVDPGSAVEGEACARESDCGSNYCTSGVCRLFCSTDMQCATGARCLAAPGLTGVRACGFEPVTAPRVDEFAVFEGSAAVDRPTERAFELSPDAVAWTMWVQDIAGRDLLAGVVRVTAPDGTNWIDSTTWTIVRDQPIRDILATPQINSVLAPSSDTLRLQAGRYRYFAGLFNDRGTSATTRRMRVVLRVKRAPGGALPATGALRLRLLFAPGVGITAANAMANARLQTALTGMRQAYATVGINVSVAGYEDVSTADAARYTIIDSQTEMDDLFATRMAANVNEVNVYFVRSLATSAGLDGAIGVAGDIVGPPGVHGTIQSGVVISWDGTANGGGARDLLSNTISHEVGHYLGLWHTRERLAPCTAPTQMDCGPFGAVDPISDTPTDATGAGRNTMFWSATPGLLTFSAGQGRVLRSSVLVQ